MTQSQAIAGIYETYTEDELRNAKDEPEHGPASACGAATMVVTLFDDDKYFAHTTRNRVTRAFRDAGHGASPADAIANARRILRRDETR